MTVPFPSGPRLVVTREFRVPIWDYEYGFPASLIEEGESLENTITRELKEETGLDLLRINHVSMPVYSSAGLTDESCIMAMIEATGESTTEYQESTENIETLLMDIPQITTLLHSQKKVAAKAWGLLYHYHQLGKIE